MAKKTNTGLLIGAGAALAALFAWGGSKVSKTDLEAAVNILTAGALKPTEFFLKYYPFAKESEAATGVPALVTLVQAGVESGWGKHAPGNNFFGIKAGSHWTGKTQKLKTWECGSTGNSVLDKIKDTIIQIFAPGSAQGAAGCNAKGFYSYRVWGVFRAYDTPRDSFIDHGKFLQENKRYKTAFDTSTPQAFAVEIARAGYATDPTYGEILAGMIDKAQLILKLA